MSTGTMHDTRTLTPAQILTWVDDVAGTMRVKTDVDAIPGGYSAAMVPILVRWQDSRITGDNPYVILRNVNYGGSPFERTTVLQSLKVPLDSVESVEFTLVPLAASGAKRLTHHVQLRFIFQQGRGAELLSGGKAGTGSDTCVEDLVLSWECWRPPGVNFSMRDGMGKLTYAIALRAFTGAQCYLEDQIRRRPWICYRLRMPGGAEGARELLGVVLALGDGAARYTLANLIEQGEEKWMEDLPPGETESAPERTRWEEILARVEDDSATLNTGEFALTDDNNTYHALVRSCAMLARYTILVAAKRLVSRGIQDGLNLRKLPEPLLGTVRPWMEEIARGDQRGLLLRAPILVGYLLKNRETVPAKIPDELDAAGLIEHRDGKRWEVVYARDKVKPYGSGGLNREV